MQILAALFCLAAASSPASLIDDALIDEVTGTGTIHAYVQDLDDSGVVRFVLFDSPEGFPVHIESALSVQDVVVSNRKATYSFEGLEFGDYAIAAVYSENGHFPAPGGGGPGGEGRPAEGGGGTMMIGVSGGSDEMPPTFEGSCVSLSSPTLSVLIELHSPPGRGMGGGPTGGGGRPGGM